VVSTVVSNAVSNAVNAATAAAVARSANFAAPVLIPMPAARWDARLGSIRAASLPASRTTTVTAPAPSTTIHVTAPALNNLNKVSTPASNAAGTAATNAATNAASKASSNAAGKAVSSTVSNAASKAVSNAASNAASKAASNAAANAASKAAANAAANAARNINIPSDVRLKQDIVAIGRTSDGLTLYRYRYIGDRTFYVGVMAQEVAERWPDAVARREDGYLEVDYGKLDLPFVTYDEWARRSAAKAEN
jgi:hypothetical protein